MEVKQLPKMFFREEWCPLPPPVRNHSRHNWAQRRQQKNQRKRISGRSFT